MARPAESKAAFIDPKRRTLLSPLTLSAPPRSLPALAARCYPEPAPPCGGYQEHRAPAARRGKWRPEPAAASRDSDEAGGKRTPASTDPRQKTNKKNAQTRVLRLSRNQVVQTASRVHLHTGYQDESARKRYFTPPADTRRLRLPSPLP